MCEVLAKVTEVVRAITLYPKNTKHLVQIGRE